MNGNNDDNARKISQEFRDSLKNGVLSELTDIVKKDESLIMCFREEYINVYYKGHSLFKIEKNRKGYKFSFNTGHERYTKTETRKKRLAILGEKAPGINSGKEVTTFYIPVKDKKVDLRSIIGIYKQFIDDFMDVTLKKDFFKEEAGKEQSKKGKNRLTEKQHQQRLFSEYTFGNTEYIFYDMELSIPDYSMGGSPDCLALKVENGVPKAIVLVEVKSTQNACIGNNGIKKHYDDFDKMKEIKKDWLIKATFNILEQYRYLGFTDIDTNVEFLSELPMEILFAFTSKNAREWTENSRQKNDNYKMFCKLTAGQKLFVTYD